MTHVLALPIISQEFFIKSDAFGNGLGVILLQHICTIAYYINVLGDISLTKSVYEKELMAVVLSIQHWRSHFMGRKFIVCIDQKSLRQLLQQRITTMDQQIRTTNLLGYHFDILYKSGLENKGVDALSRMHDSVELKSLVHYPTWLGTEEVVKEVHDDVVLKEIIAALEKGEPTK